MRQGELFGITTTAAANGADLPLQRHQLQAWQERLAAHQGPLFSTGSPRSQLGRQHQGELFAPPAAGAPAAGAGLDPLRLQPQPLSFWRWPAPPQQGAALYFVIDRPPHLASPLLLYVGETARADRRWKGEHDCKTYVAAYAEALGRAGLEARLTIRFWLDVPAAVKPRRALEQALIRHWLPAFNKETRQRWATPFQAEPS